MTSDARERWRQVDDIVEKALALDAEDRPAFLAAACGGDAQLRGEVESLLRHDRDDGFLESPAAEEAARLTMTAPRASLVGAKIGPFEVVARIGVGGMGEVYEARDSRLQRRVAIKRLPAHLSADPERVRRFRQEALATSALNHPNIVTVHEVVEHADGDLLVTELVDGVTLREHARGGALPLSVVVDIGLQVANGLAAAHSIGIVHRDVKPANVMIRRDGLVKVVDFGIAKSAAGAAGDGDGTRPGMLIGTAAYMSPEQARGLPVDPRTDVWSVGVMLYELATGASPFAGPTPTDSLAAILERDPVPPSRRTAGLPEDFDRLVARALAKDPAGRFADASELAAALKALATGGGSAPRRFPRRAAIVVAGTAAIAVAATLAVRHFAAPDVIGSLAVLPFQTRADDPDAEYLGDGIAESLIEQISRLPSLRVMARATVFGFKGTKDPLDVGRRLGAEAVLAGTVTRRGDRLHVTAELVQTATGVRLWGETYDRPASDLLIMEESIAAEIAERLRPRLSPDERLAVRRKGTDDPEAHELFLKARHALAKDTEEGDLEARRLFERAAAEDPAFVEPYVGISITHSRAATNGYAPPAESWAAADAALARALRIDPDNVAARAQRANRLFMYEWNFTQAEQEYERLARDPRAGRYLAGALPVSMFLWARGFPADAAAMVDKALEDDPGNVEVRIMKADFLAHAGRLDQSLAEYRAVAKAAPDNAVAWFGLAEVLRRKSDLPGAIDALRTAYELSGEPAGVEALRAARTEKDHEDAQRMVAQERLADASALADERYVSPLNFARLHAQAGDREQAFASLEGAFAERSPGLVFLKVDGAWDRIRDDPRFAALVRRVGIP